MKILVTGGAGFIGSHVALELIRRKHQPVVFDNLSNGNEKLLKRLDGVKFVKGDLLKPKDLRALFEAHSFDAVMHFAALSSVPESVEKPLLYYRQNIIGSLNLLKMMIRHDVRNLIFSSTAAIYGEPESLPIKEEHACKPINPYGHSKHIVEIALKDLAEKDEINYISLRYFNVGGADPEGVLGEWHFVDHRLIPLILKDIQRAKNENRTPRVLVNGNNYETPDGTCIRDYVHVTDLAEAHILALENLKNNPRSQIYNLGNGRGFSVMQIIQVIEEVAECKFEVEISPRRPGDPGVLVASAGKIRKELGWEPKYPDIRQIIRHAWEWEKKQT